MKGLDYETASQAAARNNLSRQRVLLLAKQGRIPGAVKQGNIWFIPIKWVHKPLPVSGLEREKRK